MHFMFIQGIPDNQQGVVSVSPEGGINISIGGSANICHHLHHLPGEKHIFYMESSKAPQRFNLNYWPTVIVNEISDPDTHTIALQRCAEFIRQQGRPAINLPQHIVKTRRDAISQHLQGIAGLVVPRTVRFKPHSPQQVQQCIEENQLRYPLIFRAAGDHGGISTCLLNSVEDIEQAMYAYALDGKPYYLTEYHHYQSHDGYYRKYRIVVINGKPYLRHMIASTHWLIHSSSRTTMNENPALQQEETDILQSFSSKLALTLQPIIDNITARLQLDYYGIDCTLNAEQQLLVFEINANMNVFTNTAPLPNKWQQPLALMEQALCKLIMQKAQT